MNMERKTIQIYDAITDTTIIRDLTDEELMQLEQDKIAYEQSLAEQTETVELPTE